MPFDFMSSMSRMKLLARDLLKLLNLLCFTCCQYAWWIRLLVLQHTPPSLVSLHVCSLLTVLTSFPSCLNRLLYLEDLGGWKSLHHTRDVQRCSGSFLICRYGCYKYMNELCFSWGMDEEVASSAVHLLGSVTLAMWYSFHPLLPHPSNHLLSLGLNC